MNKIRTEATSGQHGRGHFKGFLNYMDDYYKHVKQQEHIMTVEHYYNSKILIGLKEYDELEVF